MRRIAVETWAVRLTVPRRVGKDVAPISVPDDVQPRVLEPAPAAPEEKPEEPAALTEPPKSRKLLVAGSRSRSVAVASVPDNRPTSSERAAVSIG
jgi:hypothetical protein